MSQPEPTKLAEFLLSTLEQEIGTTVAVLGAVPAHGLDYRPDAQSKSAISLVRHITTADEWFLNSIAEGVFRQPEPDTDASALKTPAEAVARYQVRMPAAIARLKGMPAEQWARELDMFGKWKMPAVGFLSLAVRHSIHHRGQLSAYLRAMGGKVPSIYGPSADTK